MTYKGPPSDHFDGKKFHNFVVTENKRNFWEFLKLKPWNFDKENEDKWFEFFEDCIFKRSLQVN